MSARETIHVRPADPSSGHDVERHERQARRWHERGYAVSPVPADGREHPYLKPCPSCAPEPAPSWEYDIEGRYAYGWEVVTCEPTRAEAEERAREYRDNDPAHAYRVRRVRIEHDQ